MLRNIAFVYSKDMKEILRDRRTLVRMLLFSVLMLPTLGHLLVSYSSSFERKVRTEILDYAILGAEHMPEVASAYEADAENFRRVDLTDEEAVRQAVQAGVIKFGLRVPADAQDRLEAGEQVTVTLFYNNADSTQGIIKERASEPIIELSKSKRDWRLTFLGISGGLAKEALLNPVSVDEGRTATRREVIGERIGAMVAYFVFLVCYMGCVFTAVDLGAGEKERGTLETLLMLPVKRLDLILGKYLVVLTQGVVYSSLTLFSIAGWLMLEARGSSGVTDEILTLVGPLDLTLVWLMLVPVAGIFAALLLSLSVYARSFREATSLAGLANFLVVIAVIIGILPGIDLASLWSLVPITNVALAIKELIKGTLEYSVLIAILGSSTVIAALLVIFCTKWFERESVIFRE